ncbi:MAG: inorganic diphosphatase, partial [Ignavibacteriaceae bacterium]
SGIWELRKNRTISCSAFSEVVVLKTKVDSGSLIKCEMICVLKLLDCGEQDDTVIAVHFN